MGCCHGLDRAKHHSKGAIKRTNVQIERKQMEVEQENVR